MGQKQLKALLGVSEINKRLDYIIKKDGVLDQVGYTETTLDYPLYWELNPLTRVVEFSTVNELKQSDILPYAINDRNYKIKKPVKAFHRTDKDRQEGLLTGTFYDIQNTHEIPVLVFQKLIQHPQIGVIGTYLYGFLKMKNDYYGGAYVVEWNKFIKQTRLSNSTLYKYLGVLEREGFIEVRRQKFVFGKSSIDRKANEYRVKSLS